MIARPVNPTLGGRTSHLILYRLPLFIAQFSWFLLAWYAVANWIVAPRVARLDHHDRLSLWISPQLFRVLGLGLLVPNLAPDLPVEFAAATAIGDAITSLLAFVCLLALRRGWRMALGLAWACNIVGALDLLLSLTHAATIGAARYLTAQWYVAALVVPLMIVSHTMAFRVLVSGISERHRGVPPN